jgi:hypothetical protein
VQVDGSPVATGHSPKGLIPWTPTAFSGGRLFLRTAPGISRCDLRAK